MKIIVYIKQVPEADDISLDPVTGNLRRDGAKGIMNPNDANAVEAALKLKSAYGGTVSVVSMGPPQAEEVLKKALAMGCDEAFLLSDRAFGGADTLATSYTLAKAAEKIGGYDLLIFGRIASDGDTAQTGPAVAAQLGIPQITLAQTIDIEDGYVVCEREFSGSLQRVRAKLPAAVTVCPGINKPRYATPINIMKAQKKPRSVWNAEALECEREKIGIPGSPSMTKTVFEPEKVRGNTVFLPTEPAAAAKELAALLRKGR